MMSDRAGKRGDLARLVRDLASDAHQALCRTDPEARAEVSEIVERVDDLLRAQSHRTATELYRWLVSLRAALVRVANRGRAHRDRADEGSGLYPTGLDAPAGR